jgi:hypothetical protein
VEPFSGRRVLDPVFVDGDAGAADLESEGVVDEKKECVAGFAVREPGAVQRQQESFGHGQRVEVVPGLVELEVAVPRLKPAVR